MGTTINSSGIMVTQAQAPEEWPPTPEHAPASLLDVFSQHLIARRDHVVRRAYETLVERRPYARGRVHQRPFTGLDDVPMDDETRDKLVDVVAVFVDEAIEHVLSMIGATTNTVGEYDTVEYGLSGRIQHHQLPDDVRYSTAYLAHDVDERIERLAAAGDATSASTEPANDPAVHDSRSEEAIPIGHGVPMWYDYRRWLGRYSSFRRTARPTRLT